MLSAMDEISQAILHSSLWVCLARTYGLQFDLWQSIKKKKKWEDIYKYQKRILILCREELPRCKKDTKGPKEN